MSAIAITLCVVCQFFMVIGQLFLKHAVNASDALPRRWPRILREFGIGIACLTAWFFLWLGLLAKFPLSHLFPFEGLNPALLAMSAWLVLKEKLTWPAWLGIAPISVGIVLVIGS